MHYMAHSPYGSLLLPDYRRQQFIVVAGDIKLTDLDDMLFEERACHEQRDCALYFSASNVTLRVECVEGRCEGLNERQNVFNTARHFLQLLLPADAPGSLHTLIHSVLTSTSTAQQLLDHVTHLLHLYVTGAYLDRDNAAPPPPPQDSGEHGDTGMAGGGGEGGWWRGDGGRCGRGDVAGEGGWWRGDGGGGDVAGEVRYGLCRTYAE
jgi:hypothetical protein